jgi:hypothetical protein
LKKGLANVYISAFIQLANVILDLAMITDTTYNLMCLIMMSDRLCGLVVRDFGYRSRGPGSILGATRLSE